MSFANVRDHEGYAGAFCTDQVEGALQVGSTIKKINSLPGDATAEGMTGVILGSFKAAKDGTHVVVYFVEWADRPKYAVAIMEHRVAAA